MPGVRYAPLALGQGIALLGNVCPGTISVDVGALFKRLKTSHSCGRSMLGHEQTFLAVQPVRRAPLVGVREHLGWAALLEN